MHADIYTRKTVMLITGLTVAVIGDTSDVTVDTNTVIYQTGLDHITCHQWSRIRWSHVPSFSHLCGPPLYSLVQQVSSFISSCYRFEQTANSFASRCPSSLSYTVDCLAEDRIVFVQ